MMELFSTEFWIATLFMLLFFMLIFLFGLMKKVNRLNPGEHEPATINPGQTDAELASGSASDIIEMLEPLVNESRKAAISFDEQIKEKKRLLKGLNDALDSRIISINLFLSRADTLLTKLEKRYEKIGSVDRAHPILPVINDIDLRTTSNAVFDQQDQILELYTRDFSIDTIAEKLSIPKGEVQLVVDLKEKFIAMEKGSQ